MASVCRKAEVPYSVEEMFSLVQDVNSYSEFIPACVEGAIVKTEPKFVHARLAFAKGNIQQSFTTKNTPYPYEKVTMELVDGPFKVLKGQWSFRSLEKGCEVQFQLEFEFSNLMLKMMFQPIFKQLIAEMLQAFCERASTLYG